MTGGKIVERSPFLFGSALRTDRHRPGSEIETQPPCVSDHGAQVGGWSRAERLQQRATRALRVALVRLAHQRGHRCCGGCALEPGAGIEGIGPRREGFGRRRRVRAIGVHGDRRDDAENLAADSNFDRVGGERGRPGPLAADHRGGVLDDLLHALSGDRAGRPNDRFAQRGNRDCDRTADRVGCGAGDTLEVIACDRTRDDRQRRRPGGCCPPVSGRLRV